MNRATKIEQPAPPDAPADGDDYETIGQFYDAIEHGLRELWADPGETSVFRGHPTRQVMDAVFYPEGFNHACCAVLHLLEQAFDGSPQKLAAAIGAMHGLKVQAQAVTQIPTEDGLVAL